MVSKEEGQVKLERFCLATAFCNYERICLTKNGPHLADMCTFEYYPRVTMSIYLIFQLSSYYYIGRARRQIWKTLSDFL